MIPTPDTSHLSAKDFESVYEPAEDTFLLLDALEVECGALQAIKPIIALEIGPGSGCVSAFLGKLLPGVPILCADINPHACHCTRQTGIKNEVILEPINASFASPLLPRLRRSVDVLLFNPPYVPTESEEAYHAQSGMALPGSWAGGTDGMQVTNLLLPVVRDLLSPHGRFYLVAVKQNNIQDIARRMDEMGFDCQTVLQRRAGREHLFILRFTWRL
ncbi:S-adenosyl-L-methionine-dependent methyltransferase [Schizophyllum fasciatum]